MKNKLSILFFLFANFAICQVDLMGNTAQENDSSLWKISETESKFTLFS